MLHAFYLGQQFDQAFQPGITLEAQRVILKMAGKMRYRQPTIVFMTSPIRAAVTASADYPFKPIDAPIKLDQNESPHDFPPHLKAEVQQRLLDLPWNRYPDLNAESLCAAIAAYEGWPASGVVVTTGSNVLIALLTQLAALGQRVVTVKPNFALYALGAKLLDTGLTEVPLRADFSLDADALIAALHADAQVAGKTGVLYLPQPHAPSGSLASREELRAILAASCDWLTVIDEAYYQFAATDAKELAKANPHVVLLRTFSKAWGLAGFRLGYALTSDEVARQLRKLAPPFGVSLMQTVAAQVALVNAGYVQERVREAVQERERVYQALLRHPSWQVFPSQANFLLIRTPDAAQAFAQLLACGVLVRRQDSNFGMEGCIRMSIGTPAQNNAFLAAAGLGPCEDRL